MNKINYNYARINNKRIILLPESLRIDTIPKIESLTIKLNNTGENRSKKIYFSRNGGSYLTLLQKITWNSKIQDEYHGPAQSWYGYQKVFPNSIKSVRYTGGHRNLRLQYGEYRP